jgi:TRAP-type transport system small permease protein
MLGFVLLSLATLCKLPEVWVGVEAPHGHEEPEIAATHQGA